MKVKDLYLLPVSQKGQVTIPIEVRKMFDLGKKRKALLKVISNNKAVFTSPKLTLEQIFGSVKPIKESFSRIRKIAKEERISKRV